MKRLFTLIIPLALFAPGLGALDRKKSENLYRLHCAACHSIACNRRGPKLEGVFGRQAGSVPDFKGYSDAFKNSGIVWDEKQIDAFISDPDKYIPGSGMPAPVSSSNDRRAIISFIRLQDKSIDLCF